MTIHAERYTETLSFAPHDPSAAPELIDAAGLDRLRTQMQAQGAELDRQRAKVANLNIALTSSRMIGTAIGLVMGEYHLDRDAAFGVLIKLSQHENRKVHDLAVDLVTTHCAEALQSETSPVDGHRSGVEDASSPA